MILLNVCAVTVRQLELLNKHNNNSPRNKEVPCSDWLYFGIKWLRQQNLEYYINNEVQMTKCLFIAEHTNSVKNEGHPSNI